MAAQAGRPRGWPGARSSRPCQSWLLGAGRSATRATVWRDNERLLHQVTIEAPDNYRAHRTLALHLDRQGRLETRLASIAAPSSSGRAMRGCTRTRDPARPPGARRRGREVLRDGLPVEPAAPTMRSKLYYIQATQGDCRPLAPPPRRACTGRPCSHRSWFALTAHSTAGAHIDHHGAMTATDAALELSVVMPCLNEADTVGTCVEKALRALERARHRRRSDRRRQRQHRRLPGSDRGARGRRVVPCAGARLRQRLDGRHRRRARDGTSSWATPTTATTSRDPAVRRQAARGLRPRAGLPAALAAAARSCPARCRSCIAGGQPDVLLRWRDAGSTPRSTTSTAACAASPASCYERLDLRCTGMEFATEMIIKAEALGERASPRCPITLHPDGRKAHAPHLRTFRDGWRTLRFFLMYSPRWLFLVPGMLLCCSALLGYASRCRASSRRRELRRAHAARREPRDPLRLPGGPVRRLHEDVRHQRGLLPEDPRLTRLLRDASTSSAGSWPAALALVVGVVLMRWRRSSGARRLRRARLRPTMRWVIPGDDPHALGVQTVLSSFFVSILGLGADEPGRRAARGTSSSVAASGCSREPLARCFRASTRCSTSAAATA